MVIEVVSLIISVLLAPLNAKNFTVKVLLLLGWGQHQTHYTPLTGTQTLINKYSYHHTPNNPTQGNTAPHRG